MLTEDKVIEIFVMADEFCKIFNAMLRRRGLDKPKEENYHRDCRMSQAEIIVIMIMFHSSNHKCLKHFYLNEICVRYRHLFPQTVSYNRFTELEKSVVVQFVIFVKKCLLGKCTGISFVDSTLLRVCRNQRIHMHKVFKGIAQRGKCSLGWFYGFKLHLICNDKGEILNFMITPGDVDDREPLKMKSFVEFIYGKCQLPISGEADNKAESFCNCESKIGALTIVPKSLLRITFYIAKKESTFTRCFKCSVTIRSCEFLNVVME